MKYGIGDIIIFPHFKNVFIIYYISDINQLFYKSSHNNFKEESWQYYMPDGLEKDIAKGTTKHYPMKENA